MKNKRASHVGVVLSFVIFITFIVFMYSVLESPTKLKQEKKPILEHVKKEIINNVTGNVKIMTIETAGMEEECIDSSTLNIDNKNYIVKNENGEIVGSSTSNIRVQGDLLKIYSSKEPLNEQNVGGCENWGGGFDYGLVRTEDYIMVSKIKNLIKYYNDKKNYVRLKISLGIQDNEFDFGFYNSTGDFIGIEKEEASTTVYSDEVPVEYFDEDANINIGRLRIRVW